MARALEPPRSPLEIASSKIQTNKESEADLQIIKI